MDEEETSETVDNFGEINFSEIVLDHIPTTDLRKRFKLTNKNINSPARKYFKEIEFPLNDKIINTIKSLSLEELIWLKYENASDMTKSVLYLDEHKLAEMLALSARKAFWSIYENTAPNNHILATSKNKPHFSKLARKEQDAKTEKAIRLFKSKDKIVALYSSYEHISKHHNLLREDFFRNIKKYFKENKLKNFENSKEYNIINLATFKEENEEKFKKELTKGLEWVKLLKKKSENKKKANGTTD